MSDGRLTGPLADISPNPPRIDRDETYVGVLIALWFAGLGIYLLPIGNGSVAELDVSTQKLLAICMLIGTTLSLAGTTMGPGDLKITKPVRWVMRRFLNGKYHPMSLRHCYLLGASGLIANNVSLLFFTLVLLNSGDVIGSFTGLMSPVLFVAWMRKVRRMYREYRRMDQDYDLLRKGIEGEP